MRAYIDFFPLLCKTDLEALTCAFSGLHPPHPTFPHVVLPLELSLLQGTSENLRDTSVSGFTERKSALIAQFVFHDPATKRLPSVKCLKN